MVAGSAQVVPEQPADLRHDVGDQVGSGERAGGQVHHRPCAVEGGQPPLPRPCGTARTAYVGARAVTRGEAAVGDEVRVRPRDGAPGDAERLREVPLSRHAPPRWQVRAVDQLGQGVPQGRSHGLVRAPRAEQACHPFRLAAHAPAPLPTGVDHLPPSGPRRRPAEPEDGYVGSKESGR